MDYNFTPRLDGWMERPHDSFFSSSREPTAGAPIAGDVWFCDGLGQRRCVLLWRTWLELLCRSWTKIIVHARVGARVLDGRCTHDSIFSSSRESTAYAPIAGHVWFCDGLCYVAETLHEEGVAFLWWDLWTQ